MPISDRVLAILRRLCGDRKGGWVFVSKRSMSGHLTTIANQFRKRAAKRDYRKIWLLY